MSPLVVEVRVRLFLCVHSVYKPWRAVEKEGVWCVSNLEHRTVLCEIACSFAVGVYTLECNPRYVYSEVLWAPELVWIVYVTYVAKKVVE
jgi:hypothetical protein